MAISQIKGLLKLLRASVMREFAQKHDIRDAIFIVLPPMHHFIMDIREDLLRLL